MPIGQLIRSPQFIVLVLTNFFCCATHSGPIIHTVSYAVTCGIPLGTAVTIYSVEGLAGLGGRIAFGLAGDRFGARRTLIVGLLMQAFFAAAYYFADSLSVFYTVAVLFGFTYGGVMPLYAVLARENFPLRMMGTVIGGTAMAGSLGMATGPVLGGWLYDRSAVTARCTWSPGVWNRRGVDGDGVQAAGARSRRRGNGVIRIRTIPPSMHDLYSTAVGMSNSTIWAASNRHTRR